MTIDTHPELISAHRDGSTITLTCRRPDDSTTVCRVAAPVLYSYDAKVRNPMRLMTIYPDGLLPIAFWVTSDRLQQIGQILAAPLPPAPLYAECDHCGAPNAVLRYQNSTLAEHLCPECARVEAMAVAAEDQLELLVEQAVRAWRHLWPEQAAEPWLTERLNRIAYALERKFRDETTKEQPSTRA